MVRSTARSRPPGEVERTEPPLGLLPVVGARIAAVTGRPARTAACSRCRSSATEVGRSVARRVGVTGRQRSRPPVSSATAARRRSDAGVGARSASVSTGVGPIGRRAVGGGVVTDAVEEREHLVGVGVGDQDARPDLPQPQRVGVRFGQQAGQSGRVLDAQVRRGARRPGCCRAGARRRRPDSRSGCGTGVAECCSSQSRISWADQPASKARRSDDELNRNTPPPPRDSWAANNRSSAASPCGSGPAATAVRSACRMTVSTGSGNRSATNLRQRLIGGREPVGQGRGGVQRGETQPGRLPSQPGQSLVRAEAVPGRAGAAASGQPVRSSSGSGITPAPAVTSRSSQARRSAAAYERSPSGPSGWASGCRARLNSRSESSQLRATRRQRSAGDSPQPAVELAGGQQPAVCGGPEDRGGAALEQEAGVLRLAVQFAGEGDHVALTEPAVAEQPVWPRLEGVGHLLEIVDEPVRRPGRRPVDQVGRTLPPGRRSAAPG